MEDKEVEKISLQHKIPIGQARHKYMLCLGNPDMRKAPRGMWACLYDLNLLINK